MTDATRELPRWVATTAVALILAAMIVWSFLQRWDVLTSTPFPIGVDGYFYPVQLRSLFETGELQYPASPLAFWLLAPFAAATDPITGAKLGAAVLGALIALPAYAVGAQLGRERDNDGRGPGLVAAAIATASAGSMYMTIEFVKNGIGLTIALTALWLVMRCFDSPTRWRIGAAALGVVAAVLAHKMAAAIVIGIAIPAVVVEAHGRGAMRTRIVTWVAIAAAVGGALLIVGVIAPRRFLSPSDLALLERLFTSEAQWSLPVLGTGKLRLSYEPLIAVAIALGAAGLLIVERRSNPRARAGVDVVAWAMVGLALFIGLPWLDVSGAQGLGMRLRVIAFVPLALCAAVVMRVGLRYVMRDRTQRFGACVVIALTVIAVRVGGEPGTEGQVIAHPALVTGAHALVGRIPDGDTAIVPERHIAYMLAWYARVRISIRPEPIAVERRWRVMPLAFIRRTSTLLDETLIGVRARGVGDEHDLPSVRGLHPSHPNGLVLVPERTWQAVLEMLPEVDRARLEAWPTI